MKKGHLNEKTRESDVYVAIDLELFRVAALKKLVIFPGII